MFRLTMAMQAALITPLVLAIAIGLILGRQPLKRRNFLTYGLFAIAAYLPVLIYVAIWGLHGASEYNSTVLVLIPIFAVLFYAVVICAHYLKARWLRKGKNG